MDPVNVTVEELEGDVDTTDVYLNVPASSIPGGGDPGTQVGARVVPILPGLDFLVITADPGDMTYEVEELAGAGPDADTHRYIVATKDVVTQPDGTALTGYVYQGTSGTALVIAMQGTAQPAPGGGTAPTS